MSEVTVHEVGSGGMDAVRNDTRADGGMSAPVTPGEGETRRSAMSGVLRAMSRSRRLLNRSVSLACRLEGGQMWSATAREILRARCGVVIGAYSYGECFVPYSFPAGVVVGRYVSIANGVRIFLRNHPMDRLSTHPFFFNSRLGVIGTDNVTNHGFEIGADAWIGENAIVTPGCRRVGIGAVVGAGAVVTKDVPDFAIVVGNPARVVRMRFDEVTCEAIRGSRWWEKTLSECRAVLPAMVGPVGDWRAHPLLRGEGRQGSE
ncbi:MAG: antibiotic acetyltransferase [Phycisphaerales bacterium]